MTEQARCTSWVPLLVMLACSLALSCGPPADRPPSPAQPDAKPKARCGSLSPEQQLPCIDDLILANRLAEAQHLAAELWTELGGDAAPEAVRTLALDARDLLLEVRCRQGDPDEEEARRAVKARPATGPSGARSHYNLGFILYRKGNLESAVKEMKSAVESFHGVEPANRWLAARSHSGYANLLQRIGELSESRTEYDEGLKLLESDASTTRRERREKASLQHNFGELQIDFGEFEEAESALTKALAGRMELTREDGILFSREIAETQNALGNLYEEWGNTERSRSRAQERYTKSVTHYEKSLDLFETLCRAQDLLSCDYVGSVQSNLARALVGQGDRQRALQLLEAAEAAFRARPGEADLDLAHTLNNLGDLMILTGHANEALPVLVEGLTLRIRKLRQSNPDVAESLRSIAVALALMRADESAMSVALAAEDAAREHFRETIAGLPEKAALRYRHRRIDALDLILALAARSTRPEVRGQALDALVRSRAVVLDEMTRRAQALQGSGDLETRQLLARWLDAKTRSWETETAEKAGGGGEAPGGESKAESEITRLEDELVEKSRAFAAWRQESEASLEKVLDALQDKDEQGTLISFVLYDDISRDTAASFLGLGEPSRSSYGAFVARPGADVVFHALGSRADIDESVTQWRAQLDSHSTDLSERDYIKEAAKLRSKIWDPLETDVEGSGLIVIAPEGSLHLVNFMTLPTDDGKYLVERSSAIHYVSAERDLVPRSHAPEPPREGVLLLAGTDFHSAPSAPQPRVEGVTDAGFPGANGSCSEWRDPSDEQHPWHGVAGAEQQLLEIRHAFDRDKWPPFVGSQATERLFRELAPQSRIVHVVSHGVFAPLPSSDMESSTLAVADRADSALLRSWIVLAGANCRKWDTPAYRDNGLLTAAELAMLDLSGADWIVFSACETGLGDLEDGEGVFGLRRACHVARAKSMIMSLWQVNAEATRAWMSKLYDARKAGRSTADAVHEATLRQLEQRRAAGNAHPYWWGAFVSAGDWH